MQAYVSQMVLYRCRPGQVRRGQQDLAALVTRVADNGMVDLRVFVPDSPDEMIISNVGPMSEDVQWHCWHVAPEADRAAQDIDTVPTIPLRKRAASK